MQTAAKPLSELFAGRRLTPVQRRIAAHIVEQGSRAAFCSSVELAEQVGVSQPSVTRLAAALGYQGFGELQREIQAIVLSHPGHGAAGEHPPELNKMQRAVAHAVDALAHLQHQLADLGALQSAAHALAQTPVLPVYGGRSAAPLARQFEFFAAKIHPDVRLIAGSRSDTTDQLARAADAGAEAMLAVALPRYPRELLELLQTAERCAVAVVLVTDSALSQPAELASHVLAAPVSSDLVFDAAVAPLQLLAVLLEALADAAPARTRARLERFEALAAENDYFTLT